MGQLAKHKGPVDQGVCPDAGHTVPAQDSIPVFRKYRDKCLEALSATYSQMIQREKDVPHVWCVHLSTCLYKQLNVHNTCLGSI